MIDWTKPIAGRHGNKAKFLYELKSNEPDRFVVALTCSENGIELVDKCDENGNIRELRGAIVNTKIETIIYHNYYSNGEIGSRYKDLEIMLQARPTRAAPRRDAIGILRVYLLDGIFDRGEFVPDSMSTVPLGVTPAPSPAPY